MASKEEYLQLTGRVSELKERRAILVSKEEQKAQERKGLLEELEAAGIDPSKPREEIDRLEKEIQEEYDRAKAQVDQFEEELKAATNPTPHPVDVMEGAGLEVPSEVREQLDERISSDDLDLG